MSAVTLHTGESVASDSPAWRDESLARHQHVETVLAMRGASNRGRRAAYIEALEATNSAEFARRVSAAVKAAWPKGQA